MSESLRGAARAIFAAAMQAVDVRAAVRRHIAVRDGVLQVASQRIALASIDEVLIVSMGKAALPMVEAAAASLDGVRCSAVVIAPLETLPSGARVDGRHMHIRFLPGDHPAPTANSLQAARTVLELLSRATERTAVLFLISGGASAMVEQPLSPAITLDDLADFSRALVGSGMNIIAMNTLRKHLSAVKGGRLAQTAAAAAMQCTLLISDVPAMSPGAIGSGPSLPDTSTVIETRRYLRQLQQVHTLPSSVEQWFLSPYLPETPKPGDAAFARAAFQVILSAEDFAAAALEAAAALDFRAVIDNDCDDWEYRHTARHLLDRREALAIRDRRTCLVSVGEVTVHVPSQPGEGGRNQHFALWCATELARRGQSATVLSAGSDGVDGHSSAAGAVCDETTVLRAAGLGLDVNAALATFDSAPLLRCTGDSIHTGPTGNNLRDLRLLLTE